MSAELAPQHISTPEHETAAAVLVRRLMFLEEHAASNPLRRAELACELVALRRIGYAGAPERGCPVCAWCFAEPGFSLGELREAL